MANNTAITEMYENLPKIAKIIIQIFLGGVIGGIYRILRFLENMCLGASAVGYRPESMHGAGSPQAQRIMIARQGDIQGKKKLAKNIAGIK